MTSVNIPAIRCAQYSQFELGTHLVQFEFYELNLAKKKKLCNSEHFLQKQDKDTIKYSHH